MKQEIRFCTAPDGARIAYATVGDGPPLVKAANWLNHLEFDWESPVWRHVFRAFARDHRLIRYDARGNGLSDWDAALSFDAFVSDLETVVDAAGIERFALLGVSQGCAVSVAYAVKHPERVSRMVLYGGYPVGWGRRSSAEAERFRAMVTLARTGWGTENPAFRQMFSSLYLPEGTPEEIRWFNDLQHRTTSPENAARLMEVLSEIDVRELLPRVSVPTLVLHTRGDVAVPFESGRALAARIPDARFVALEGLNHLLLEHDPAWPKLLNEIRTFLGVTTERDADVATDEFLSTGGALRGALGREVVEAARERSDPRADAETVALDLPRWLAPGYLLADRYRLQRRVGQGAMGAVFLARDTTLERDVAVKVVAGAGIDRAWRTRALREARAAAALNHPNIVAIHDVGEEQGAAYMVMEYVPGPTLEDIPPGGMREAVRIACRVCSALDHAHRRGLVHRDLKPANLLLVRGDDEDDVKLADLGIALYTDDSRITATGNIVGTPRYMAPEQALDETIDARADLYALGAMLYEWLTGEPPFVGETPLSVVGKHIHAPAPPPSARLPGVPGELDAIVLKLLAKKPDDRYAGARDVKRALEAVLARLDAPDRGR